MNNGVLPGDYFAEAERAVGGYVADVLTLERLGSRDQTAGSGEARGETSTAVLTRQPKVRHIFKLDEGPEYAQLRRRIAVRQREAARVVAFIEILSPGNKTSQPAFDTFVRKSVEVLQAGIHLVVVDLHPRTPRDSEGVHNAIWTSLGGTPYEAPPDKPLVLASYDAGPLPQAYVEPVGVGDTLIDMPLFLVHDCHVLLPLDETYSRAFEGVPRHIRSRLEQVIAGEGAK